MQRDKIESLLGFAVKAGKVIYGSDNIVDVKRRYYLVIICDTLAENSRKKVIKTASEKRIPVILSLKELQYAVNRTNCKAVAITDKQMSDAMIGMTNDNYRLISSEVK